LVTAGDLSLKDSKKGGTVFLRESQGVVVIYTYHLAETLSPWEMYLF